MHVKEALYISAELGLIIPAFDWAILYAWCYNLRIRFTFLGYGGMYLFSGVYFVSLSLTLSLQLLLPSILFRIVFRYTAELNKVNKASRI